MKYTNLILMVALGSALSVQAATTFLTNNTTPKTLASNEGDTAILEGLGATDTASLTLSADDGGGTIGINIIQLGSFYSGGTAGVVGMDGDSMGYNNGAFGGPSQWMRFSFDEEVDFSGFTTTNSNLSLRSNAWANDTTGQSGTGWTFTSNGTFGEFVVSGGGDFSGGTFSTVAAGTAIDIIGNGSGNGVESFEITVIPEPSTFALMGLVGLAVFFLRRRR